MSRHRIGPRSVLASCVVLLLAVLASACGAPPAAPPATDAAPREAVEAPATEPLAAGPPTAAPHTAPLPTAAPPTAASIAAESGAASSAQGDSTSAESIAEVSTAVAARTPVPTPTPGLVDREVAELAAEMGWIGKEFMGIEAYVWLDLAVSALIVLLGYLLGIGLLNVAIRWVASRTNTELDKSLVRHLEPDLRWLIGLFVVRYAVLRLDALSDELRTVLTDAFFLMSLLAIAVIGTRIIRYIGDWYKAGLESDAERLRLGPVVAYGERIAILVLLVLVLSMGLTHFGVNIGLLAIAIIVAAVVVSLGAKDVITDAISGLVILVDQPFRVDDALQIKEFDTWGDVIEIGGRTTRILTRDNREMIIPNTQLLNSRLMNYTVPDTEFRLQTELRIAYDTDLEEAREVIAGAVREADGVLLHKPVDVLFIKFGCSARRIRVRWWAADYHLQYPMIDRVCTAIQAALIEAGIDVPITQLDVNVSEGPPQDSEARGDRESA